MTVVIRKTTISELESSLNIHELLNEYAEESSIGGLPHPSARVETYKHLESVDAIYVVGAFLDDTLVGFIVMLFPMNPHYSIRVAVIESFFVSRAHRKTGAGLKLLRKAEGHAQTIGSVGLLVSAPFGGNLAEVMPHIGYRETNRVFFRSFANE